ncbi:MAG: glutathione peroxidase [Candidatus Xenobia bacterium]
MTSIYDIPVKNIEGQETTLAQYRGKVMLIVNVASKCGFTPQYAGLESLYQKHQAEGLVVLGFPCNQFGSQEPGNEEEIKTFCSTRYNVSFPMFAKVDVNGDKAHPLYQWLKHEKPGMLGESIKWNFAKFLVGKDGKVLKRFHPQDAPESLSKEIAQALKA